ncbi:cyclic nucleotide-binding protein [Agaricicola taiwanensis]|uniref:Cyclic nucleotide-binding protein n=1 Tax=Agaricicola taiwanensis TaxID=591372 RepID=A0A8J2VJY0_9RHOB|nr:cyclic nucleotide-binding domain-containing protein [Agaricicola taiwanensis]GGE28728.1 cyclic nucleotide-binding protein [Agaricicola taiwanensis]
MALDDDIRVLERAPMLGEIGHDPLRLLAFSAERRTLRGGEVLFRKGDRADGGFVIASGTVRLGGDGEPERRAGAVSLIGEIALLCPVTRPVSAVAETSVKSLFISRSLFRRVLTEFPSIAVMLRERMLGKLEAEGDALKRLSATLDALDQ